MKLLPVPDSSAATADPATGARIFIHAGQRNNHDHRTKDLIRRDLRRYLVPRGGQYSNIVVQKYDLQETISPSERAIGGKALRVALDWWKCYLIRDS